MGKNAAGDAEEDWNAIFGSPVGRRLWYHVKIGLTRLPSWDPRLHVIEMGKAPTMASYMNLGITTIYS